MNTESDQAAARHGSDRYTDEQRHWAAISEDEREMVRTMISAAIAVVREHLPVKPGREEVARAWHESMPECGPGAWDRASERVRDRSLPRADAVLSLLPGRSEAEVRAEALREWIAEWPTTPDDGTFLADVARDGLARADRLAAEGGADRG